MGNRDPWCIFVYFGVFIIDLLVGFDEGNSPNNSISEDILQMDDSVPPEMR